MLRVVTEDFFRRAGIEGALEVSSFNTTLQEDVVAFWGGPALGSSKPKVNCLGSLRFSAIGDHRGRRKQDGDSFLLLIDGGCNLADLPVAGIDL